jgi:Lon protease-like protein
MEIPREAAVMILPEATLFPQALLPLFIFEPRYRRMLAESLDTHRLFAVAMLKPGATRESPMGVAGLGLIRASVQNPDGTSHLVLQGLTRIELEGVVRYRPYRVHRIRPLQPAASDSAKVDPLLAKVRDLARQRMQLGPAFGGPDPKPEPGQTTPSFLSAADVIHYLEKIENADQVADIVSCALLSRAQERQMILETVEVETRLRFLIAFLMAEIRQRRKNGPDEKPD